MEYRKLNRHARRSHGRVIILPDLESLIELLDEEPEGEGELLEEIDSLRTAVNGLELAMLRACEGIEQVASLLYDALNPTLFPEPLRDGPPIPERDLSYNGLIDFSKNHNDVPF